MVLDIVRSVVGDLPLEYEFIYYFLTAIASFSLILIVFMPFKMLMNVLKNNKGGI